MTDFLQKKRDEISELDEEIMSLIRKRLDVAVEIGKYKSENNMEIFNPDVQKNVIERYRRLAKELEIDPEKAEAICKIFMDEAIEKEKKCRSKK